MAQSVEHILGKDEVTSSNLVSSSNNEARSLRPCFFVSPISAFVSKNRAFAYNKL